ncbi:hypothetical protein EJ06DRAFT_532914 [Trichodelitschia bisporula]|uniref:Uncharacterized protein n=1 Tax=Trichodelitschia bisporula TaxID=703511 RepID=A0A6G1HQ08_9PEZI|nr:hypothetical protein EJ06DRAFT_532914 [Trichodelitschia bisporula]
MRAYLKTILKRSDLRKIWSSDLIAVAITKMVDYDLEKGDQQGGHAPHSHHIHGHAIHTGRRLRHFLHPNGRKVHVASTPDEAERLKRHLSVTEPDGFDLVIHGSEDHINALRESHNHHEQAREQLRVRHGSDFDHFEQVVRELDKLSTELHMVSEHAVQLDANFEKYGYSAHLRTIPNSGHTSSASSLYEDHSDSHESHQERHMATKKRGEPMLFWKKPIVRQYFHKGLLWRAQEEQHVASYELFLDLFYVGIIAIAGDGAAEAATGEALLRFAIVFVLSWKFWTDLTALIAWFDADDVVRRLTVLFTLTCLLGFTTNIAGSWETTYTPLIAFYLASRWSMALYYVWMAYLIPMVRPAMICCALADFVPGLLWIGSIQVEEPNRQALIWVALFLDIFGPPLLVLMERGGQWMGKRASEWSRRTFDFIPGASIEHKIERTNAFVALVFGYSVIALLYQSSVPVGINAFFGKAVLGLIQAFTFNWLYFEIDTFNMHTHAIRRHFASALVWLAAHLPFVMAFVLAGSALSKVVLAHDTAHAHPHDLREPYDSRSEEHLPDGLRWFYCGGLAIALAMTGIISLTHTYRSIPNVRLGKPYRVGVRFAVAVIILLLPLAHGLNSLELVATTTGLVVLVLVMELAGSACSGDTFWGFWSTRRTCMYSARCHISRKELEAKVKSGELLNVEEVAKRDQSGEVKEGYAL